MILAYRSAAKGFPSIFRIAPSRLRDSATSAHRELRNGQESARLQRQGVDEPVRLCDHSPASGVAVILRGQPVQRLTRRDAVDRVKFRRARGRVLKKIYTLIFPL